MDTIKSAIIDGDIHKVRRLCSSEGHVMYRSHLYIASITYNRFEIFEFLLHIYGVNQSNLEMYFRRACQHGNILFIQLVDELCHRYSVELDYATAADNSASSGHIDTIKYLHETYNIDLSVASNRIIRSASWYGHLDIVQYVCDVEGTNPSDCDNAAITHASFNGHLDVVKYLVENHGDIVDPGARDSEVVYLSVKHIDVLKYVCSLDNVYPSAMNNRAVARASAVGTIEAVEYLCSLPTVDPSANHNAAFIEAITAESFDIADYLRKVCDISERDMSIELMKAIRWGVLGIVKYLCGLPGVDTSESDNYALHIAQEAHYPDIVEYLSIIMIYRVWIKHKLRQRSMYKISTYRSLITREIKGMPADGIFLGGEIYRDAQESWNRLCQSR